MRAIFALLALGLVACHSRKGDTGEEPEADADTDADSDTDADVGPGDGCEEGSIPEVWPEVIDDVEVHFSWGGHNAALGDVDGDGYDDIALDDALVLLGPLCPGLFPDDEGLISAEFDAGLSNGYQHLDGAGDVDGDGLADSLIGDEGTDDFAGAVFLVLSPVQGEVYLPDVAAAVIVGETTCGHFGGSVAGVGDVDGDGVPDLLAGAEYETGGGAAWVISGSTRGCRPASFAGVAIRGSAEFPTVGSGLAALGDTDGDGLADFLVGTSSQLDSPAVALFRGPVTMDQAFEDAAAMFLPRPEDKVYGGMFGLSISSAGDQDGDGLPEIAIGAPWSGLFTPYAGVVMVYSGAITGQIEVGDARSVFVGERDGDNAGRSVDLAGDVNGDGQADLVVGAYGWDGGRGDVGAVYVVLGPIGEGSQSLAGADVRLVGTCEDAYQGLGTEVLGAGDTNGDGLDDVLVTGWSWGGLFHSHLLLGRE